MEYCRQRVIGACLWAFVGLASAAAVPSWPDGVACTPKDRFTPAGSHAWVSQCYTNQYRTLHGDPAKDYDLVTIGDSITHNWGWKDLAGYCALSPRRGGVLNLAISGDRTEHVLWRLEKGGLLENYTTKFFTLLIGVNNSFQRMEAGEALDAPEEIAAGIGRILHDLGTAHPEAKVLLMPIIPYQNMRNDRGPAVRANNEAVNDLIIRFVDNRRVFWLDLRGAFLQPDGTFRDEQWAPYAAGGDGQGHYLHPSARGYKEVFDPAVSNALARYAAVSTGTPQETDPSLGYATARIDGVRSEVTLTLCGIYLGTDASAAAATSYALDYRMDGGSWVKALSKQTLTRNTFTVPAVAVGPHTCEIRVTTDKGKSVSTAVTFAMCDAWTAEHLTTDSACVRTNGTLLYAYARGDYTANGVAFKALTKTDNDDLSWGVNPGFNARSAVPVGIGDRGYAAILANLWWFNGEECPLTMKRLTPGEKYLVQVIANRSAYNRGRIWIDGTQADVTYIKAGGADWGLLGGTLVGAFTADAPTKQILIRGRGSWSLNAVQVRKLSRKE